MSVPWIHPNLLSQACSCSSYARWGMEVGVASLADSLHKFGPSGHWILASRIPLVLTLSLCGPFCHNTNILCQPLLVGFLCLLSCSCRPPPLHADWSHPPRLEGRFASVYIIRLSDWVVLDSLAWFSSTINIDWRSKKDDGFSRAHIVVRIHINLCGIQLRHIWTILSSSTYPEHKMRASTTLYSLLIPMSGSPCVLNPALLHLLLLHTSNSHDPTYTGASYMTRTHSSSDRAFLCEVSSPCFCPFVSSSVCSLSEIKVCLFRVDVGNRVLNTITLIPWKELCADAIDKTRYNRITREYKWRFNGKLIRTQSMREREREREQNTEKLYSK